MRLETRSSTIMELLDVFMELLDVFMELLDVFLPPLWEEIPSHQNPAQIGPLLELSPLPLCEA